jgi:hypothetical protein
MREKGWSREFDQPIELHRGRQLVTLEDVHRRDRQASHLAPDREYPR